ncbi:helix-turn-helix domain-containing protein [Nocardia jiangxiensis]|uniref:helix-turn-helix domain-containing protein n=1 Tax=Nocardia jiangxiensis TaxID=282685 RepID=UPI000318E76C|nr:helix-turn-helix transcriptional regulator [Nocardia jiangxiensis]
MEQSNERDWTRADFTALSFDQRKEVAEQITAERKARNITQEDLARLAGVPVRTISNVESGKTPQAETLRKLADALDSTPRGKPNEASAIQMFTDVTAPMYLQLSEHGRAKALRDIVLLLGAALEDDREPQGPGQSR